MIRQIKYAVKYALGLDRAGKHFTIYPDDTFLVSYPKSGNTWCRFLVANLLHPNEKVGFANINRLMPAPGVSSKRFLKSLPRPRIMKSHEPFDVRFRKVIYLVRDPRDVAVSEYHFDRKKGYVDSNMSLDQFVEKFLAGESSGYGSWWEHVASWIATREHSPSFLLVRYEDLLSESVREMQRIADFLGIKATSESLQQAIDRSSADRMRKLERQQSDQWTGTKNTNKEIPFVRAAKSGGWRESLPPQCVEQIESAWYPLMNYLGYRIESSALDQAAVPVWTRGQHS